MHLKKLNDKWLHLHFEDGGIDSEFYKRRENIKRALCVTSVPQLVVLSNPDCIVMSNRGMQDIFAKGNLALLTWQRKYMRTYQDTKYKTEKRLAEKLIRRHCSIILANDSLAEDNNSFRSTQIEFAKSKNINPECDDIQNNIEQI